MRWRKFDLTVLLNLSLVLFIAHANVIKQPNVKIEEVGFLAVFRKLYTNQYRQNEA